MSSFDKEPRHNSYVPPADNRFDYQFFAPEESPRDELLAKQVQAQSYLNMKFVRPEGLIRLGADEDGNDIEVLASDVGNPVGMTQHVDSAYRTEYVLGRAKDTTDENPYTGQLVTWKKYYAPLDALPAYQFCKDALDEGWEDWLRQIPQNKLVEIEAMGKTKRAGGGTIIELMRNEIRRARTENPGEVWYFNIVDTTYDAFISIWGPLAVRQIGAPKHMDNPNVYDNIHLIPAIIDPDSFFDNMLTAITAPDNAQSGRLLKMLFYMTDGMRDDELSEKVVEMRRIIGGKEEQE